MQTLPTQIWFAVQTSPQLPQLCASLVTSTHCTFWLSPQLTSGRTHPPPPLARHSQELGSGELPSSQDGTQASMQSSVPSGQLQFPLAASVQIEPLGQQTAPHATVGAGQAWSLLTQVQESTSSVMPFSQVISPQPLSLGALHSLWQCGSGSEPQVLTIEPWALPGQPAAAQL